MRPRPMRDKADSAINIEQIWISSFYVKYMYVHENIGLDVNTH